MAKGVEPEPSLQSPDAIRRDNDLSTWNPDQAKRYEAAKHGPDGKRFLDPHLYDELNEKLIKGSHALDIGAGAGPWTEYLQRLGAADITAVDLNPAMLELAKKRFGENGIPANVHFELANAAELPLPDNSLDVLLSINVGCNLPPEVFQAHFREAYRVAKPGAKLIVTAPDSLLTVFTDGQRNYPELTQAIIDELWRNTTDRSVASTKSALAKLTHVLRATFVLDTGCRPILVTEENKDLVEPGKPILRKIPGLVVDNNFHTAEEYEAAAADSGWKVGRKYNERFDAEVDLADYNTESPENELLGPAYVGHPPFLLLSLEKSE